MPLKDKSIHLIFVVFRSMFRVDGYNVLHVGYRITVCCKVSWLQNVRWVNNWDKNILIQPEREGYKPIHLKKNSWRKQWKPYNLI